MELPKLYSPTWIRFWSLRNGIGGNMGVIFDIDTVVERKAMRVRTVDGWKWQIVNFQRLLEWDYDAQADQDVMDICGSDLLLS